MIWHYVPKHTYVGWQTFAINIFDAVAHFNIGNLATLRIFKSLGIEPGIYTRLGCSASNKDRVENARCHNKATYKLRQQIICGNRKQKADEIEGVEGKLYCPGIARWIFQCCKTDSLSFRILLFWCFNLFGSCCLKAFHVSKGFTLFSKG